MDNILIANNAYTDLVRSSKKKFKCIDCGNPVSTHTSKRCQKCYLKKMIVLSKNLEYREKQSKSRKLKWQDPIYKKKQKDSHTGYKFSKERLKLHIESHNKSSFIEKISATNKIVMRKPVVQEKRNETLSKHLLDGSYKKYNVKYFNTKPELKVLANYIAKGYKEGIDIVIQYHCKGIGMVDFYLPKENTLIFVDGDYWHCNPSKYKPCFYNQNLNMFAKQVQDRDINITNKCKELGYKVIRIWENVVDEGLYG